MLKRNVTLRRSPEECNSSTGKVEKRDVCWAPKQILMQAWATSIFICCFRYDSCLGCMSWCKSDIDVCIGAFQGTGAFTLKTDMGDLQLRMWNIKLDIQYETWAKHQHCEMKLAMWTMRVNYLQFKGYWRLWCLQFMCLRGGLSSETSPINTFL